MGKSGLLALLRRQACTRGLIRRMLTGKNTVLLFTFAIAVFKLTLPVLKRN